MSPREAHCQLGFVCSGFSKFCITNFSLYRLLQRHGSIVCSKLLQTFPIMLNNDVVVSVTGLSENNCHISRLLHDRDCQARSSWFESPFSCFPTKLTSLFPFAASTTPYTRCVGHKFRLSQMSHEQSPRGQADLV